jgi:hypothetical protein
VRRLAALVLGLLVAACGGPAPTTPPPPGAPTAKPAPAPGAPADAQKLEVPPGGSSGYEAKGRRDPFEVLSAREGGVGTVSSARLTGIIRRENGTALALVETPDGLGYILRPGDTLGEGRVVEIGPNSVVFSVPSSSLGGATTNRVVLKLASDR